MSYLATYKVPTTDWQDWLDGKVAFDTDKGACVSPEECEETRKEVREYWLGWGGRPRRRSGVGSHTTPTSVSAPSSLTPRQA